MAIRAAHSAGIKVGICGQAPSNYPDFAEFLVREGIDSISLNPDSFLRTAARIAEVERALGSSAVSRQRSGVATPRLPHTDDSAKIAFPRGRRYGDGSKRLVTFSAVARCRTIREAHPSPDCHQPDGRVHLVARKRIGHVIGAPLVVPVARCAVEVLPERSAAPDVVLSMLAELGTV
jgi:hypothetical protein